MRIQNPVSISRICHKKASFKSNKKAEKIQRKNVSINSRLENKKNNAMYENQIGTKNHYEKENISVKINYHYTKYKQYF